MNAELSALRSDVDSLTVELLDRYEEITLLYDLAKEMGVVVDLEGAAATALRRSLQVIPALFGIVLVGRRSGGFTTVAACGEAGTEDSRSAIACLAATEAVRAGSPITVNAGHPLMVGGRPLEEPVLVAPLTVSGAATTEANLVGVLAFVGHADSDRFSAAEAQLCAVVAGQLGQGMENARVVKQLREKDRLEADLDVAAGIQGSLLPGHPPLLHGAQLAAACLPAAQVGGDYFDFLPDTHGAVSIVVADVAGHGLGPGLIMVMARSVFRAELRHATSLAAALQATNMVMWDDLVATEAFITVFVARYQPETRILHYANAGHPPALLRHTDGSIEELTGDGLPLGILTTPSYELSSRQLDHGDAVLIFSDGVVEASAPDGGAYGIGRLKTLFQSHGDASPADVVAKVLAEVAEFEEATIQNDDITVVVLHVSSAESLKGTA